MWGKHPDSQDQPITDSARVSDSPTRLASLATLPTKGEGKDQLFPFFALPLAFACPGQAASTGSFGSGVILRSAQW